MLDVSEAELRRRIALDNPWWEAKEIPERFRSMPRRAYLDRFIKLFDGEVRRAVVLMGPRRVGKTVMLYQSVHELIEQGVQPNRIFYVAVDTPVYSGLSLERLLTWFVELHSHSHEERLYVIFDEIQYLKDWERHLKSLVDTYPNMRFSVSGSAAAALRMKSRESGAGRFTDYLLPPLTFVEFAAFVGIRDLDSFAILSLADKEKLFVDYVNFGGFPEAIWDRGVQENMERYVANDIIDKVLLRDLPSLYGIDDTQELNRLFSVLAYNSGQEVNIESLSSKANIAKNTLRKYIIYLEAAFLIHRIHRIDENANRFKRQTHFKIYLTNPSLRAAMFGPISADDAAMGDVAETAYLSQWLHSNVIEHMYYARWQGKKPGEVDVVTLLPSTQTPHGAVEVKWGRNIIRRADAELAGLIDFARRHTFSSKRNPIRCVTREESGTRNISGVTIKFSPLPEMCYVNGHAIFAVADEMNEHPRKWLALEDEIAALSENEERN